MPDADLTPIYFSMANDAAIAGIDHYSSSTSKDIVDCLKRISTDIMGRTDVTSECLFQNGIVNHAESAKPLVNSLGCDRVREIVLMIKDDNPDIFWCAYNLGAVTSDGTGVVFNYVMTSAEVKRRKKQIEKAIKPFIKGIKPSMSDYEVALRAHENIVSLIDYDSVGLDMQDLDPESHKKPDNLRSIYGVFVEKKAVCAGYAKAFQYLLNRLGIECTYVIGECHGGGLHAWNLIKLEGDYYYVDVTFGDSSNTDAKKHADRAIHYDYFCITTDELLRSRNIRKAEYYPECTATKCNYYIRSDLYFKEYDATRINKLILDAYESGKKEVAFRMANKSLFDIAFKRLVTDSGVFDIMRSSNKIKAKTLTYTPSINEPLGIIHIMFY